MTRADWLSFMTVAPLAFGLTWLSLVGVDAWRSAPATDWWGELARFGRCLWGHG